MNPEEHDDLWQLLGRARPIEVSPFFARNVMREVRRLQPERRSPWRALLLRWQPLVTAACLAFVAAGSLAWQHRREAEENRQLLTMAERVYTSPDYTVINDLDELLDTEKNSAWLASDVH